MDKNKAQRFDTYRIWGSKMTFRFWQGVALAMLASVALAQDESEPPPEAIQGLGSVRAALGETERPIRVLARLSEAAVTAGGSATEAASLAGVSTVELSAATSNVARMLSTQGISDMQMVEGLTLVTFVVDSSQLDAVAESGQFVSIVEDRLAQPTLASSGNVINVPDAHNMGARGAGHTVAILDTGVDTDHVFLNGRVVEGACFSSNVPSQGATSLCPGGATSATTVASGNHCSGVNGCSHGTHVAGIAAGRADGPISLNGVAPDADIMAVQVFSRFDDVPGGPATCAAVGTTSPCVLSYTSDQIRGLQRVRVRAADLNIVAANMSLGGGRFTSACDATETATKAVIDLLNSDGVATVIASGNDGFRDALGAPACISTAVSVGSTTDADLVSGFSNMADVVDLLAPGSSIESSVPGGANTAVFSGTSMATPQVAGAFAALASLPADPSNADILNALQTTGVDVTDNRTGGTITKPRIDVHAAAQDLAGAPLVEDCLDHNLANLRVRSRGWWFWRRWSIVDGNRQLFYFGRKRSEAFESLDIIQQFGFTNTCYIGRPDASMQYLRAGNSVPNDPHGSLDCITFNRAGIQLEPAGSEWRLTDGVSSMLLFPNEAEGQQAVAVINHYALNRQCFVGRPGASFTYWLAE